MSAHTSEWSRHRQALALFVRNETSLGCYGVEGDLERARSAMRYFAQDDGLGKLLADLDRAEAQRDDLLAALESLLPHRIECRAWCARVVPSDPCTCGRDAAVQAAMAAIARAKGES